MSFFECCFSSENSKSEKEKAAKDQERIAREMQMNSQNQNFNNNTNTNNNHNSIQPTDSNITLAPPQAQHMNKVSSIHTATDNPLTVLSERDKEMYESKINLLEAENLKLKANISNLQNEIERLKQGTVAPSQPSNPTLNLTNGTVNNVNLNLPNGSPLLSRPPSRTIVQSTKPLTEAIIESNLNSNNLNVPSGAVDLSTLNTLSIVSSLLSSESEYISGLRLLVSTFVSRLRALITLNNPLLSPIELQKMFLNVENILDFHVQLYSELMESKESHGLVGLVESAGKIFHKFFPFFKLYKQFVKLHREAITNINSTRSQDKTFDFFCAVGETIVGRPLVELLSLPLARLEHYLMYIGTLHEHMTQSLKDPNVNDPSIPSQSACDELGLALDDIRNVTDEIASSLEMEKARRDVVAIQLRLFNNTINLMSPSRYLIKYDRVNVLEPKSLGSGNTWKRAHLIAFNDSILYASVKGRVTQAKVKAVIPMSNATAIPCSQGTLGSQLQFDVDLKFAFQIISPTYQPLVFQANSDAERDIWINKIRESSSTVDQTINPRDAAKSIASAEDLQKSLLGKRKNKDKDRATITTSNTLNLNQKLNNNNTLTSSTLVNKVTTPANETSVSMNNNESVSSNSNQNPNAEISVTSGIWRALFDERYSTYYYYNTQTGESQWEKPAEFESSWQTVSEANPIDQTLPLNNFNKPVASTVENNESHHSGSVINNNNPNPSDASSQMNDTKTISSNDTPSSISTPSDPLVDNNPPSASSIQIKLQQMLQRQTAQNNSMISQMNHETNDTLNSDSNQASDSTETRQVSASVSSPPPLPFKKSNRSPPMTPPLTSSNNPVASPLPMLVDNPPVQKKSPPPPPRSTKTTQINTSNINTHSESNGSSSPSLSPTLPPRHRVIPPGRANSNDVPPTSMAPSQLKVEIDSSLDRVANAVPPPPTPPRNSSATKPQPPLPPPLPSVSSVTNKDNSSSSPVVPPVPPVPSLAPLPPLPPLPPIPVRSNNNVPPPPPMAPSPRAPGDGSGSLNSARMDLNAAIANAGGLSSLKKAPNNKTVNFATATKANSVNNALAAPSLNQTLAKTLAKYRQFIQDDGDDFKNHKDDDNNDWDD